MVDDDMVVLPQDQPFAPGGRFASLLIRDRDLAEGLAIGFDGLWKKAMKHLREISFQRVPLPSSRRSSEGWPPPRFPGHTTHLDEV